MASYALSEREAGSDAAAMRTRAKATATTGSSTAPSAGSPTAASPTWYTVMAVTDPDKGANGISSFMVHKDDEGFVVGPQGEQAGHQGFPHRPSCTSRTAGSPATASSASPAPASRPPCATLDHTRPTIGAQAVGLAQGALDAAIAYTKDRKQFGKTIASSRTPSSCSPIWR